MNPKRESLKGKGAGIFLDNFLDNNNNDNKQNTTLPVSNNTIAPDENNTDLEEYGDGIAPDEQIRSTYFMSYSTTDKLEEVCFILKRKFKNRRINKSKLVEIAIDSLLKDWEENKGNSQLEKIIKTSIKK